MITFITPSYTLGTGVPPVRNQLYKTGAAIIRGTPLIYDTGELTIAAATPVAGIVGIALQAAGTAPGYDQMNSPTVNTGRSQKISFAKAIATTVFASKLVNNTLNGTFIAPAVADIGVNYGLLKQTSVVTGVWCLDRNLTGGSACATVVDIDTINNIIYWVFLPASITN
jgi:hypothetical protein